MQLGAPRAPELGNPSFRKRGPSMARSRSRMKIMGSVFFFWGCTHIHGEFHELASGEVAYSRKIPWLAGSCRGKGGGESYLATWLLQHTANSAVL